jgi:hypothetical protein
MGPFSAEEGGLITCASTNLSERDVYAAFQVRRADLARTRPPAGQPPVSRQPPASRPPSASRPPRRGMRSMPAPLGPPRRDPRTNAATPALLGWQAQQGDKVRAMSDDAGARVGR